MAETFKCCKNKPNINWICTVCHNIYHPSCCKRSNKHHKIIYQNWIWCSEECADKGGDTEAVDLPALRLLVAEKSQELESKNKYIARLRRHSTSFEGEVTEMEARLVSQIEMYKLKTKNLTKIIEEQNKIIEKHNSSDLVHTGTQTGTNSYNKESQTLNIKRTSIATQTAECSYSTVDTQTDPFLQVEVNEIRAKKAEISELMQENEMLWSKKNQADDEIKRAMQDLAELRELNQSMIQSIRVLEADNLALSKEALSVRSIQEKEKEQPRAPINQPRVPNYNLEKQCGGQESKGRLLIICDEYGRHLDKSFRVKHNKLVYQTIIKPGACFEMVTENIIELTKDFTLRDYVLILAGSNNFDRMQFPSFKDINSKLKYCTHTNLIFTSIPYRNYKKSGFSLKVKKFNDKLKEYADKLNHYGEGKVSFCDINTSYGRRVGKMEIVNILITNVFNKNKNNAGLIYINTQSDLTEKKDCESEQIIIIDETPKKNQVVASNNSSQVVSSNDCFLDQTPTEILVA